MAVKKAPNKKKSTPTSTPKAKPNASKASKSAPIKIAPKSSKPAKTPVKASPKVPPKAVIAPLAATKKTIAKAPASPLKGPAPKALATKAVAKPVASPTSPVTTKKVVPPAQDAKPVKQPSGLKKADFDYFRNLLLEKRREILGDVGSMESEAFKAGSNLSNMPIHMADVGTDNFEQEFTLGLIESERQILREIQEALGRVDDGSFGVCLGTGKPIPRVRLEAVPWAKYTIEYSRMLEQGLLRRDSDSGRDDDGGDDDEE